MVQQVKSTSVSKGIGVEGGEGAEPMWAVRPMEAGLVGKNAAEEASVMAALRAVSFHLTHQGFELGKDFSLGQGQLILSAVALHYLEQQMGAASLAEIKTAKPDLLIHDNRAAMDALEAHLKVPFFATLKDSMLVRLPILSDSEMLGYVTRLMQGFGQRHPEIGGFDQWVKQVVQEAIDADQLRQIKQRYGAGQIQVGDGDGWIVLIDVLRAAGGVENVHFQRTMDGLIATQAGKKLLDQVIAGAHTRVVDWL